MNRLVCLGLIALVAAVTATTPDEYAPVDGVHYDKCVQIREAEPCKQFPDGLYNICDVCHLGYKAHCTSRSLVIIPCELSEDENGNKIRLTFDSQAQTCTKKSSTCYA